MSVSFFSKNSLEEYVRTAEFRAGRALNLPVLRHVNDAFVQRHINPSHCPLVLNYTDRSWNWDWSSRPTTIIQSAPAAPKSEKEKEEERLSKWKVIGGILTIGAAGLFAFTLKPALRTYQTVQKTREASREALPPALTAPMKHALRTLIKNELEIDETLYDKTRSYAIAAFGCLASAAAITIGAFAAASALITAGQILLIASVAAGVFATVYYWNTDQELSSSYQNVVRSAQVLLQGLPHYNDHMYPLAQPPHYEYVASAFFNLPPGLKPSAPPPPYSE